MNLENDKKVRLGILLSGTGRSLVNIIDHIAAGKLDVEIAVVIASRPCKGLNIAREAGLPTGLVAYRDYGQSRLTEYSNKINDLLDQANIDIAVLAGFLSMWLIPDRYAGKVINIHPSLLPKHGGKGYYGHHVHNAVLASGDKESGCTVHFVTNEYDRGQIILQRKVVVKESDTPDELAARVFEQECIAFPEAIRKVAEMVSNG